MENLGFLTNKKWKFKLMKKMIKNFNYLGFILALCATVIFSCRCSTSKPSPDPLAGWQKAYKEEPNEAIVKDCQDYIQKLSPEERKYLGPSPISYFEDGIGQHAIKIEIGINGKEWEHILIYDKDNKRIKTIKYLRGRYMS